MGDDEQIEQDKLCTVSQQVVTQSDEIKDIAAALSKAQGKMDHAHKDSKNPFFNSKYSDIAACWDACRKPLSDNDLAIIQTHSISDKGDVVLTTQLIHKSGQWFKGTLSIRPTKNDPQMYVSATTYGRRCGLCAMVGISPSDDDGNAASGKGSTPQSTTKPKPTPKGGKAGKNGKGDKKSKDKEPETPADDGGDTSDDYF